MGTDNKSSIYTRATKIKVSHVLNNLLPGTKISSDEITAIRVETLRLQWPKPAAPFEVEMKNMCASKSSWFTLKDTLLSNFHCLYQFHHIILVCSDLILCHSISCGQHNLHKKAISSRNCARSLFYIVDLNSNIHIKCIFCNICN